MLSIKVQCYAGHRSDQRPTQFTIRARTYRVLQVEDQWYDPEAIYFKVRADDGNLYILRHDEAKDDWTLDAFRSTADPE